MHERHQNTTGTPRPGRSIGKQCVSSIAHAGFILTGLTAPGAVGIRSAVFYLVAYAAMTVGAFGTVMLVSGKGEERTRISDYAGLARTDPVAAALMTLFLLSLAGVPPTDSSRVDSRARTNLPGWTSRSRHGVRRRAGSRTGSGRS